jgi:hypothetical protein
MERLLLHSVCGFHALFKNHEIKAALKNQISPERRSCPEHRKKVELLISNLVEKPSLTEKIGYLNNLDPESYSLVVHTYMEILESALRNLHPHKNIH